MKKHLFPLWMLCAPLFGYAQVGIGTTTPNLRSVLDLTSENQGFLVPRMTGLQKSMIPITAEDAGMMVYQTDTPQPPLLPTPKGLYYFDGTSWISPITNGAAAGQTLRWDGTKWTPANNLFNQGSSIGIGTQNPKNQLHIHSPISPATKIQFTNSHTGTLEGDGLVMGNLQSNGQATIVQNENRALCFGTNATERMRIDSMGNMGIGRIKPQAMLDVNGTVRIGADGTIIRGIMKETIEVEIPVIAYGAECMVNIPFDHTRENASVYVSPGSTMAGLMIAYARVNAPGNVEVKFMNMSPDMDEPMTMTLHVSVIQ